MLARVAALATACGLALLGNAGAASANEFKLETCMANPGFSTQAFEEFATRGMKWKRACNPFGSGLRGLVTSNVVRSGRVRVGATSRFVLKAPPGTYFSWFDWSGQARRRDCRYALQIWASRPAGPPIPIKNVRANRRCPRPGLAQAAGWDPPERHNVPGATRITQRIVCVGSDRASYCSSRGLNYIRTLRAEAGVVDFSPPTVGILQDNAFTQGQWVNGAQTVNYDAHDNVGVKLARAAVGGVLREEHPRGCDYSRRIPCANGPGAIRIDTTTVAEGTQPLAVHAFDSADNGRASDPVQVRVDNTAPGAVPVAVEGGEGWRNQNDFGLVWENPDEGDRAPIAAAHYRVCAVTDGSCAERSQRGPGIDRLTDVGVPAPGEWRVRVWREDAATNRQPANASVPVTLRFDPEPPQLGFEDPSPSDPTLVSVLVTDKVSGLAGGQIELGREGSGVWQVLPTQQQGNRLIARLDDAQLPAGTYLLRATARDQAANQNSTESRLGGEPMRLNVPLRIPTAMTAGVVRERNVRKTIERRGKRRRVHRRITTLDSQARVGLDRAVTVRGRLANRDGQPIPDAEVHVLSRSPTSPEQLVGVLQTTADGGYTYVARASSTRVLRFVYSGTQLMLPAEREVTLLVPAATTIRPTPRRLRNGQAVRFGGRLRSLPPPAGGKLVELQVSLSGHWQTFRTTHTDPGGAWDVRYRFRRSCGLTRYRFRARVPAEAGYPFETGHTRAVKVVVRGGSCR